jgi:hypothetical protein
MSDFGFSISDLIKCEAGMPNAEYLNRMEVIASYTHNLNPKSKIRNPK